MCDQGSRLGFRGTENLGNGLKAVFTIETGVNIDNGGNNRGKRLGQRLDRHARLARFLWRDRRQLGPGHVWSPVGFLDERE